MATGLALAFAAAVLQPPENCGFLVRGTAEAQSEVLRLVNLYRETGALPSDASHLSIPEIETFVRRVHDVRDMIREGAGLTLEPDDGCIQAASLFEAELAMALAASSRWEAADAHFDSSWKVSFLIYDLARRNRFQRDWLLAAGLFLQQLLFRDAVVDEAYWRADRFFHNAVRRYPEDPEILLAAGALLEWSGTLRSGDRSHLKEAEALYARARALTPDDPLLLLRHGVVLEKLERAAESKADLERVLELGAEEDVLYRARMTLGKIAELAGRFSETIAHYEAASTLIPRWQAAYVALAEVHHAAGSHERAREMLGVAFSKERERDEEAPGGFWSYELGLALRVEPLLARMRHEVRK
jgi:tetratricopeptide (TPR) repeat protein